jgi:transmembrane sensor
MTKEEFQYLLHRYKTGNCSAEEIQKIDAWFSKISDEKLELGESEKGQINERMLHAIRQTLGDPIGRKRINPHRFLILKVAASLIVFVLVLYLLFPQTSIIASKKLSFILPSPNLIEHKNTTQELVTIQLPDSSTVELKPNAAISYSKKWEDQKREVHLIGEAFFNVVKDSSKPFYVYGGAVVTKVLGTSFSVKATENSESVEVSVHTGKVSVYEDPQKNNSSQHKMEGSGVILTPNEKVEYFVHDKHWVTSLVEQPRSLPASNKGVDFVFSSTPMCDIIKRIERTYSIGVIMESEASYACTFTGDVSMMELYDMLDVICKSTGTNYEVKGTKILITGRGCE